MLQKEVIDRMTAQPATSDYGRLSVMLQWRYAMENVLFVPPESFDPPPRVDSAVVRMVPLAKPPSVDQARLGEIVQVAFSQRRKLLRHSLGKWLEQHGFAGEFETQRRAEEVPVAEYVAWHSQSRTNRKARRRRAFLFARATAPDCPARGLAKRRDVCAAPGRAYYAAASQ